MYGVLRRHPYMTIFTVLFTVIVVWSTFVSERPRETFLGGVFLYIPLFALYLFFLWIFAAAPKRYKPGEVVRRDPINPPVAGGTRPCPYCSSTLTSDDTKCPGCGSPVAIVRITESRTT